jgi:hypothetical protein
VEGASYALTWQAVRVFGDPREDRSAYVPDHGGQLPAGLVLGGTGCGKRTPDLRQLVVRDRQLGLAAAA